MFPNTFHGSWVTSTITQISSLIVMVDKEIQDWVTKARVIQIKYQSRLLIILLPFSYLRAHISTSHVVVYPQRIPSSIHQSQLKRKMKKWTQNHDLWTYRWNWKEEIRKWNTIEMISKKKQEIIIENFLHHLNFSQFINSNHTHAHISEI
jgi:hypothetical protein